VDDLYTARAANRQPAPAGCGGTGSRDDLLTGPPPGSRPLLAVGGRHVRFLHRVPRYADRRPADGTRPLAGCGRLLYASGYQPGSHTALHSPHIPHGGAHHKPCSGRAHTCGLRQDPPPLLRYWGPAPSWGGLLLAQCWAFSGGRSELQSVFAGTFSFQMSIPNESRSDALSIRSTRAAAAWHGASDYPAAGA
jgi:hypothetical protein